MTIGLHFRAVNLPVIFLEALAPPEPFIFPFFFPLPRIVGLLESEAKRTVEAVQLVECRQETKRLEQNLVDTHQQGGRCYCSTEGRPMF